MVTIIDVIWQQMIDEYWCALDQKIQAESTKSGSDFSRDREPGHPRHYGVPEILEAEGPAPE